MEQKVNEQVSDQIREQWSQIYPRILDQFTTVSKADLEAATTADDLARRIADKSHFSERYVETQLTELVLSGGERSGGQTPFGQAGRRS